MRSRGRLTSVLVAVAAVGILVGVATPPTTRHRPALTLDQLPHCNDNQYIVYQGGRLACSDLGLQQPSLPNCNGMLVTYTANGDTAALACTAKGTP